MKKLFLFDIDKTLITNTSEKSFSTPINNLHGLHVQSAPDYSGLTDKLILELILRSEGWSEAQINEGMPELLKELDRTWHKNFHASNITLVPGVKELLNALMEKGHLLGLITGNLEGIAKTKLAAVNIDKYFEVGAFGNDSHRSRAELVRLAVRRAGYTENSQNVYVIGDTPLDVKASLDAGIANAVGVSNGFKTVEELEESGASITFNDFKDLAYVLSVLEV